jgi:hypothetical protein
MAALSLAIMAPFSFTLATHDDVSNIDWESFSDVIGTIESATDKGTLLVESELAPLFFWPCERIADTYVLTTGVSALIDMEPFERGRDVLVLTVVPLDLPEIGRWEAVSSNLLAPEGAEGTMFLRGEQTERPLYLYKVEAQTP